MPTRITVEFLRKHAEHNEGCLSNLEEITLHQREIERIEVIGDVCRKLQILYLMNNYIPKIEGLVHLKHLKYLNLAVNNITLIEGLEGCEMLEKLDLTVNFIEDMNCVRNLRANPFLETLHLTGNPCTRLPGYRAFVVAQLPHLTTLDSTPVQRSEAIVARQDKKENQEVTDRAAEEFYEEERKKAELLAQGIDPFPPKYDPDTKERLYGHSPEERMQMLRETQEEEKRKKNPPKDPNSLSAMADELKKKPKPLTPQEEIEKYGHVLMKNEAKLPFRIDELDDVVELHVEPGKFVSTTLINVDVQPTYARVTVKDKVLCVHTPVEVAPDKAGVQRATTTGHLKITMPVASHILQERKLKKARYQQLTDDAKM